MKKVWLYFISFIIIALAVAELFAYRKSVISSRNNFQKQTVLGISDGNPGDGSFSFAVIGDTQRFNAGNPGGAFQSAVREISKANPGVVMTVGDLVSSCDGSLRCEKKFSDI